MSENENLIHTRLVAGTTRLNDYIKELGYEPILTEGNNQDKITYYELKGKYLKVGHNGITLFHYIKDKYTEVFQGLTVHDELLTFFTKRDYNHDKTRISDLSRLPGRRMRKNQPKP